MRIVKLTNAKKWPVHNNSKVHANPKGGWNLWRGKEIVIEDARNPDPHWTCGTKKVFTVSRETLLRMRANSDMYPYIVVCEHQICQL